MQRSFINLVGTWYKAFSIVCTKRQAKNRLQELQTWDKPKEFSLEHCAKITALKSLIA